METTNTSNRIIYIVGLVIVALVLIAGVTYVYKHSVSKQANFASADSGQPLATDTLNKSYTFPINDAAGQEVGSLIYILQNAELRDQILVKGQPVTAVKGKTFLILNLKIQNKTDKAIQMNTRDYVRVSFNNGHEWLAPDIHNDPVEVQAISTKYTRLGFAINSSDANHAVIQVGEIKGTKQHFSLHF